MRCASELYQLRVCFRAKSAQHLRRACRIMLACGFSCAHCIAHFAGAARDGGLEGATHCRHAAFTCLREHCKHASDCVTRECKRTYSFVSHVVTVRLLLRQKKPVSKRTLTTWVPAVARYHSDNERLALAACCVLSAACCHLEFSRSIVLISFIVCYLDAQDGRFVHCIHIC
mmetsp:Transcript_14406/g.38579  ORF Transcript_14406/g.38579 Transcript_14406/m.38579 type:complete len:172 (+) Transcript_14406:596-1111(+)